MGAKQEAARSAALRNGDEDRNRNRNLNEIGPEIRIADLNREIAIAEANGEIGISDVNGDGIGGRMGGHEKGRFRSRGKHCMRGR